MGEQTQLSPVLTATAVPVLELHNPWLSPCSSLESFPLASFSEKGSVASLEDLDGVGMLPNNSNRPSLVRCVSFSILAGLMHSAGLSVHGYSVCLYTSPSSYSMTRK